MILSEKQEWEQFLNWFEDNKDNLPSWINLEMSMHECRAVWKEKLKMMIEIKCDNCLSDLNHTSNSVDY